MVIFLLSSNSIFAQEESELEKLIFSGEHAGKTIEITVTPKTPLVGAIYYSIACSKNGHRAQNQTLLRPENFMGKLRECIESPNSSSYTH